MEIYGQVQQVEVFQNLMENFLLIIPQNMGLSNNIVWSILEDKTGKLWFATQGGGISRFDGTTFSSFTTMEGLSDDTAYDLLADKEGNIFIGTNLWLYCYS
jgi:ligand-binding sensor domain-containing protein